MSASDREMAAMARRLRALGVQDGVAAEETDNAAVDAAFDAGFGPAFARAAGVGRALGRLRVVANPPSHEAKQLYAVAAQRRFTEGQDAERALTEKVPALKALREGLGECSSGNSGCKITQVETENIA